MKLSDVTKRISFVQGFIGALPGLVAIIAGLGILPDRELLFRSFIVAVLFIVTTLILASKDEILAISLSKKIRLVTICLVVSGLSLLLYLVLYDLVLMQDDLVVEGSRFSIQLYLPLFAVGELSELFDKVGRFSLIRSGLIEADIEKYRGENTLGYAANDFIFISLYLLIVVPLNLVLTSTSIVLMDVELDE